MQAALICEHVLQEKDGVQSLIRVADRLVIQAAGPDAPDRMPPFEKDLTLLIILKSGEAVGAVPVRITLTKPSGLTEERPLWEGTIAMEGGVRGNALVLRIRMRIDEAGPHWFNLFVGDELTTKIPLDVIYTFMRTGGPALR